MIEVTTILLKPGKQANSLMYTEQMIRTLISDFVDKPVYARVGYLPIQDQMGRVIKAWYEDKVGLMVTIQFGGDCEKGITAGACICGIS